MQTDIDNDRQLALYSLAIKQEFGSYSREKRIEIISTGYIPN